MCACACASGRHARTQCAEGWGETPLSVAWVWPSALPWEEREKRMRDFCVRSSAKSSPSDGVGHPLELGHLSNQLLDALLAEANAASRNRCLTSPR
jgi:hypothetical protein